MSSSPRAAPLPSPPLPELIPAPPHALPFVYSEVSTCGQQSSRRAEFLAGAKSESDSSTPNQPAQLEQARELGRQQGAAEAHKKFDELLARERAAIAAALAEFTRERAVYYRKIEEEAVQLALAIGRKILHREAQVDPLLLMGIVRVALERIEGATGVTLAVAPQQAPDWLRYLAARMEPGDLPEIVEDPAMTSDRCELRTSMGTAQLGVEVQLKEIEQGFADLLAARPETGG
jgi:flagellar biosynthesis/type III secretory pathway protein FliH